MTPERRIMLTELSEAAVKAALRHYEYLFSIGDVEGILDNFTDDVEVQYGSMPPFTGKDKLREALTARFASMRDYQLSKQLEFISSPHYAASWTGTWVDAETNEHMAVYGVEILTVRDGKFCRWSAGVSVWPQNPTKPEG
ncbi:nuclear transport factor 2 family protein [Actinomadura sp.]|uniref:nuclear transport factor 2 family protein n=2 Tax=Actinomadura sp. TaxID=1989 RepID=UPI0037CC0296